MTTPRTDPDRAALTALAQIAEGLLSARGGDLGYDTWRSGFRELVQRDPIDTLLATVLGGGYLFWLAEKDANPQCRTLVDAILFVASSLSLGYDEKFAVTNSGKALAAFIMTFGPGAAERAFDPPLAEQKAEAEAAARAQAESIELQKAILAKLEAILGQLEKRPA